MYLSNLILMQISINFSNFVPADYLWKALEFFENCNLLLTTVKYGYLKCFYNLSILISSKDDGVISRSPSIRKLRD